MERIQFDKLDEDLCLRAIVRNLMGSGSTNTDGQVVQYLKCICGLGYKVTLEIEGNIVVGVTTENLTGGNCTQET